jgi:hypothetical protein
MEVIFIFLDTTQHEKGCGGRSGLRNTWSESRVVSYNRGNCAFHHGSHCPHVAKES